MAVSQDPIRDSVSTATLDRIAPRRETIEELLRDRSTDAVRPLAAYWRANKSAAAAHFVTAGFRKLQPQLDLVPCRLTILRSFTVEPLVPLLTASAFSAGIGLDVELSDFNAYAQEILDPASRLYASKPDVVILAVQTADIAQQLGSVVASFRSWIETFRAHSSAHLIVHNLQVPAVPARGILDAQSSDSQSDAIIEINRQLRSIAAEHSGVHILDYDGLVARHGRARWTDESKRLMMSLPIATANLIHLCDEWMRFIHPLTGKIAKAIVVDLDNTLWSGILGEDGVDRIQAGIEYPGSIHRAVQQALVDLRKRGILLAIASKNDEQDALSALANHPDMLLRPEDFAAFRIGWQEKSQSLREIAGELNIGLDAIAFVDDNPVERERVASELPEVIVVDLPEDPIGFARALREQPAFERLTLSEEDLQRGRYYTEQRQRDALQRASRTPEEFFRSLQQVVEIRRGNPATFRRIAQLTGKTNQFNLTTRRYSEQDIESLADRDDIDVFSMRVKDVYNDNGIVAVAIVKYTGPTCEIDTFLLSCRVIGRTVETALLSCLSDEARAHGASTMTGWFRPTRKNAPAADFYTRHGFAESHRDGDDVAYTFDLSTRRITRPDWIRFA